MVRHKIIQAPMFIQLFFNDLYNVHPMIDHGLIIEEDNFALNIFFLNISIYFPQCIRLYINDLQMI